MRDAFRPQRERPLVTVRVAACIFKNQRETASELGRLGADFSFTSATLLDCVLLLNSIDAKVWVRHN